MRHLTRGPSRSAGSLNLPELSPVKHAGRQAVDTCLKQPSVSGFEAGMKPGQVYREGLGRIRQLRATSKKLDKMSQDHSDQDSGYRSRTSIALVVRGSNFFWWLSQSRSHKVPFRDLETQG